MTEEKDGRLLQIDSADNVALVLSEAKEGEVVPVDGSGKVQLREGERIPLGHKVALGDIEKGEEIVKYGNPMGRATERIKRGSWVHTHNVETNLDGKGEYSYRPAGQLKRRSRSEKGESVSFPGYRRENGEVGVRNEIWVLNTVGCVNGPAERITTLAKERLEEEMRRNGVGGVFHFPHPFGCSQVGEDLENTQKILAGLAKHPNAGGVLLLGLGCEKNRIEYMKGTIGEWEEGRIRFLDLQTVEDDLRAGLEEVEKLIQYAGRFERESVSLSQLKIGLECGGSDSFSGITANPLLGRVSDEVTSHGGTALLTEISEIFGAENLLMDRAKDEGVFREIVQIVEECEDYLTSHGRSVHDNPSPGNIEGGITTIEEKALGNIAKGGSGRVEGVARYGERVEGSGLWLLQGPANDGASITALAAAGAQVIFFTTGRGTPLGGPVPTIKVSSNSQLARRKGSWIDFDAGRLIPGEDMEELAEELFTYLLEVASGKEETCNEVNDYREIALLKTGVTL